MPSEDLAVGKPTGHFLNQGLMVVGGTQSIVGGAIVGLMVLDSIRKQAEQARESKPISSTPPQPLH